MERNEIIHPNSVVNVEQLGRFKDKLLETIGPQRVEISASSDGGYYLSNGTTTIGKSDTLISHALNAVNAQNASAATRATLDGLGNNIANTYVKATDTKDLTFSGTLNVDNDTSITLKSSIITFDGEVNVPEYLYVLEDWLMVLPAEGGGTLSLAEAYVKKSDIVYATNADIDGLFS